MIIIDHGVRRKKGEIGIKVLSLGVLIGQGAKVAPGEEVAQL